MFLNNPDASTVGGLATAVPSEIAGYWAAHQIAGKLPWRDLFEPTIQLCLNGFPVSENLAWAIQTFSDLLRIDSELTKIFFNATTNDTLNAGDTIKFTKLGKTLQIIADGGMKAFYDGELSPIIVEENNKKGGILTLEDLRNYKPIVNNSIQINLNGNLRYFGVPPPSSGVLVGFILNLMSRKFLK